jgi:hypothetical protein
VDRAADHPPPTTRERPPPRRAPRTPPSSGCFYTLWRRHDGVRGPRPLAHGPLAAGHALLHDGLLYRVGQEQVIDNIRWHLDRCPVIKVIVLHQPPHAQQCHRVAADLLFARGHPLRCEVAALEQGLPHRDRRIWVERVVLGLDRPAGPGVAVEGVALGDDAPHPGRAGGGVHLKDIDAAKLDAPAGPAGGRRMPWA